MMVSHSRRLLPREGPVAGGSASRCHQGRPPILLMPGPSIARGASGTRWRTHRRPPCRTRRRPLRPPGLTRPSTGQTADLCERSRSLGQYWIWTECSPKDESSKILERLNSTSRQSVPPSTHLKSSRILPFDLTVAKSSAV